LQRIELLQSKLKEWEIDLLLLENPVDLFYLTGLHFSKGRLLVSSEEMQLFVDGRYLSYATEHSPCPVRLWDKNTPPPQGRVGFDSSSMSVDAWEGLRKEAPDTQWKAISKPLKEIRAIKDQKEIDALRKAADLTWKGIKQMKSCLRVGVSEQEIAWEFEQYVRTRGATGLSFEPIVAFGKNSALPHHRASANLLEKGQLVLFDVGAIVDSYSGDATRVYFFGDIDPQLKKMYTFVREAHLAARKKVSVGKTVGELDRAARDVFAREGVEKLFVHSLGHGIGLETHEYPLLRSSGADINLPLQLNMVFTIEPGLYLPGSGGVRLEDTGLVSEKGFESFYPELEEDPTIR
jgi:Xaa-Pro aminopeptidase